ncbi:MAG: hypothetical protein US10_C0011G0017 [Candidatus Moranbacteria bacterium GW2011_GWD2_36_198]|nr:MAG: hypothetical protein US10_C0011G0017 [Candidatus Moranbacteria bacterium GW2011_GWD2_36_198]
MLNYILPPIIIVISISILIMFLFKKAAQIPAGEFIADEYKRESEKNTEKMISSVGQFGLKLLERIMHRTKLFSLKFHNVSNAWFQTIREKRQRSVQLQKEEQEKKVLLNAEFQQADETRANETVNVQYKSNVVEEVRSSRPMVKDAVTMPRQKMVEALIKRIAVNPRDIEAYERLGDYYLEGDNFQDSLECFKQVLRLSPAHHKARLRIRRLERMK